jgi:hypothetical protein
MVAFIDSYMLFLGKHHRKVLVFWVLWFLFSGASYRRQSSSPRVANLTTCACLLYPCIINPRVAGLFGLRLLSNTKTQYNPPNGTPSAISQKIFTDAFPVRAAETALVVLVSSDVVCIPPVAHRHRFYGSVYAMLQIPLQHIFSLPITSLYAV